ncbi:MAG: hypothetical protein Unbinned4614contig1000_18 [Prokaryotic dsDNA virus sp.]|nr:MAG: hypothetical protein Unbinned4614contig1000_18 [Prokaryotic dsDNA virus sp.]|tara:strand:- start:1707 stop:2480 length:774 start_codon:yes stop_codon:yes gene_type:complete
MAEWAKWCAISCTHVPYQSERAIDRLLEEIKGRKLTHFIHLGDVIDGDAASVHSSDPAGHSLYDEFIEAADLLRRIREALPSDCNLILLDGNHDDNVMKPDARRIPKSLRDLCNPRKMDGVADEYKRWKHVPYRHGVRGCYQLGSCIFTHGYAAGANSDELESIQLAMACGGHAHRLIVRGHTHRPVPPTQCKKTARVKLPWWYANVGYMAFDETPSYAYRFDTQQWGRACLIGECQVGRPGRMGKNSWNAKLVRLD